MDRLVVLLLLLGMEFLVGYYVVRGFKTGIMYVGPRFGQRWEFIARSKHPFLYWLAIGAFVAGMIAGPPVVFWP